MNFMNFYGPLLLSLCIGLGISLWFNLKLSDMVEKQKIYYGKIIYELLTEIEDLKEDIKIKKKERREMLREENFLG